jgi:O-antigen ligase
MTGVIAIILIVSVLGLAVHLWGFARCASALLLVSVAVFPRNLTQDTALRHIGIATASPRLTTYLLTVGTALACTFFRPKLGGSVLAWLPFALSLALGASFAWSGGPAQESGIIQLMLAPAAWAVGVNLSSDLAGSKGRFLVHVTALIIFLQLAVCVLQSVGVQIFPMEATQEAILGSRTNGTLGHPNDLGKVMFLLLAMILPFGRRLIGFDSFIWKMSIGAAFLVLAMTGGRAVSAAAVCMLALWAILAPRQTSKNGRKVIALGVALSASAFLAGALLARFDEDPGGGARSTLTDIAWAQILSDPWAGVGPNSYVDAVGSYDALTASGVPVHNAFLLALAELGIVGTILLLLPFLVGAIVAVRHLRISDHAGEASRVYIAALPGLCLIGTTGWGILGGYVLPLLALTFGLLNGWAKRSQPDPADVTRLGAGAVAVTPNRSP